MRHVENNRHAGRTDFSLSLSRGTSVSGEGGGEGGGQASSAANAELSALTCLKRRCAT